MPSFVKSMDVSLREVDSSSVSFVMFRQKLSCVLQYLGDTQSQHGGVLFTEWGESATIKDSSQDILQPDTPLSTFDIFVLMLIFHLKIYLIDLNTLTVLDLYSRIVVPWCEPINRFHSYISKQLHPKEIYVRPILSSYFRVLIMVNLFFFFSFVSQLGVYGLVSSGRYIKCASLQLIERSPINGTLRKKMAETNLAQVRQALQIGTQSYMPGNSTHKKSSSLT